MKNWFFCLSAFVILNVPSIVSAQVAAKSNDQLRFESLRASPGGIVKFYNDRALLVKGAGGSSLAIFVTVQDAKQGQICGYGTNLLAGDFETGLRTYRLKSSYFCPFGKYFLFLDDRAAGVGNLSFKLPEALNLEQLADELDVDIEAYSANPEI